MNSTRINISKTTAYYLVAVLIIIVAFFLLGGGPWIRNVINGNRPFGTVHLIWSQILIGMVIGFIIGLLAGRRRW